jgi:hypothetical protein
MANLTNSDIETKSGIILTFLGFQVKDFGTVGIRYTSEQNIDEPYYEWESVRDTRLHYSWDALKPVIDKIIETIGVKVIDECSDLEWRMYKTIFQMYIGITIEQAYHYVTEFCLWYNNNNKKIGG